MSSWGWVSRSEHHAPQVIPSSERSQASRQSQGSDQGNSQSAGSSQVCATKGTLAGRPQAPGVGPGKGLRHQGDQASQRGSTPSRFPPQGQLALRLGGTAAGGGRHAEWKRNPPEEYKELFAEIDQAAAAYNASIEQGLKLSSQLRDAADDLDALAGELQEEAEELKTIEQASRKQRRARSLN